MSGCATIGSFAVPEALDSFAEPELLYSENELNKAIEEYSKEIYLYPNNADAWNNRD